MEIVNSYFNKNKQKINQIFKNQAKDDEIPATKLFNFLQLIFQVEEIKFMKDDKNYFNDDENNSHTQNVIEKYYKTTQGGSSKKFYLYRVNFTYQAILEYLAFWINNDKIAIQYPAFKRQMQDKKKVEENIKGEGNKIEQSQKIKNQKDIILTEQLRESKILENQFLGDEQKKAIYIETYQKQIQKLQTMLVNTAVGQQTYEISQKINLYKQKILQLQKIKVQHNKSKEKANKQKKNPHSPQNSITEISKYKRQVNLKNIFQFYARPNNFTGVKASFQRIEHESQTINYQKLVHFLKQYDIFPEKASLQKKLHNLYVRVCSSTRDLFYPQFMMFLQKYAQIIIELPPGSFQTKKQVIMDKIYNKSQKSKVLHNPFHSLQKNDFRINSHEIKYSFKLKPIKGKIQEQVINELQNRKKIKEKEKVQSNKEKQQMFVKRLKKLMAIDPYHPEVVKNADLLNERSQSLIQSVANLDNMQKFRDNKFDMKAQFGISHFDDHPLKEVSRRYDMSKRVVMLQRLQSERMDNIMSNLIVRQQAKIQRFSHSPKKRQASSKLY